MYKRLARLYKRHINTLNILKITLVAFFVLMYSWPFGSKQAQAAQTLPLYSTQLVALTPEIVTVAQSNPTIQVTTSQYQQQQASQKAAVTRLASVVRSDASPEAKRALVQSAAAAFGIDWKVLEAVWQIESGKAWVTNVTSYAGAVGPCQFMPSTWRSYAVDGNGDGVKDITSAQDCLYGSAKLLATNGASSGNVVNALLHYNHSMAYVQEVLKIASSI